ncbi:YbaB/EbfC family DNA-binding protein [Gordonia polyisoprenivorans]|uniref:YbaB/EbfC family DNA-binding protein n=1 Tax=Gordonia polyisoprenivorans TaxID=84595 RepID=UPI002301933A|nr:YbaB/EbfC family DNA-binding protein [Gordonia polyisoprenivorans]WCB40193.1 YbaB/EbfC family DNA-binding protein [Gordonia polyisoprenivorans]
MNSAMDELESRATTQLGRLHDFSDELARIRVRESSADDLITVEVDGSGAMTGLWLADGAGELGGARLGSGIVATAMLAAQRAFARRAAMTEDFTASFAELVQSRPDGSR